MGRHTNMTARCLFFFVTVVCYVSCRSFKPVEPASLKSRYDDFDFLTFSEQLPIHPSWRDGGRYLPSPRAPFGPSGLPIARHPGYYGEPLFRDDFGEVVSPFHASPAEGDGSFKPSFSNDGRRQHAKSYLERNALYRHQVEQPDYNPEVYYDNRKLPKTRGKRLELPAEDSFTITGFTFDE